MNAQTALDQYNEYLDNSIDVPVQVAGIHFDGSTILRTLDPIAYRVGFHDYLDAERIDLDELEGWEDLDL